MKQLLTYILLEYKRFIKTIPGLLTGTIALALIAWLIAFCAENILSPDSSETYKVKVALVFDDDSPLMKMLTDLLKDSDCTSSCEFIDTDIETARRMVENNQVAAAIVIPDGFVESVKNGSNTPIDVEFANNSTIIALILRQLSVAGAGTLSAAQAGIYAQYDLYYNYDLMSYDSAANEYLNEVYLKYVLQRGNIFHKTPAYPTGNLSIPKYYKCAGIGLVLLLVSITCSTFLCECNPVFEHLASSKGLTYPIRFLVKLLVLTTFCCLLLRIPFPSMKQIAILLPAVICSNCIALMVYRLCSSPDIGIFTVFIFQFVSAFLSGYFIPVSFFPDILKKISEYIPAKMILQQMKYTMEGGIAATLPLLMISLTAFTVAVTTDYLKCKRGNFS